MHIDINKKILAENKSFTENKKIEITTSQPQTEISDDVIKTFSRAISNIFCGFIGIKKNQNPPQIDDTNKNKNIAKSQKQQEIEKHKKLIIEKIEEKCKALYIDQDIIDKLIKAFDFENAEIHLENLDKILSNYVPRLPKAIKNGYFSSKEGAEALDFAFNTLKKNIDYLLTNAKHTDVLKIRDKNFHTIFNTVPEMLKSINLEKDEAINKFYGKLNYISENETINKIFLKMKKLYPNLTVENYKYLDRMFTAKIEEEKENEPQITKILEKLAQDYDYDLTELDSILRKENISKFDAYKKAYKYLEQHHKLESKIIIIEKELLPNQTSKSSKRPNQAITFFDKNGNFLKSSRTTISKNHVLEVTESNDGFSTFESTFHNLYNSIILDMKTEVYDKDKNLKYIEFYEKAPDEPRKFNIIREFPDGTRKKLGYIENTKSGNKMLERTIETANDGTVQHLYISTPDSSKLIKTKFENNDKKLTTEHSYKYKVLNENTFETVENGQKYRIEYKEDKVVVTKNNEKTVTISIGNNSGHDVLSEDLLSLLKEMPGSFYFLIDKFGLKKIGKNINCVAPNNAHFAPDKNLIAISEGRCNSLFTFVHEFGHYIYNNLDKSTQKTLKDIFLKEYSEFMLNQTNYKSEIMQHLFNKPTEMFAEVCALMFSTNYQPNVEARGQLLQEHFPRTYQSMMQCIKEKLNINT